MVSIMGMQLLLGDGVRSEYSPYGGFNSGT
jgi:hypothetical protein